VPNIRNKEVAMYNIIQHELNEAQLRDLEGERIITPSPEVAAAIQESPDNEKDIDLLASAIIGEVLSAKCDTILAPGGSPALMAAISIKAYMADISLKFSHSVREYSEVSASDGSVTKTNRFKHENWITLKQTDINMIVGSH
jgi:hypothetical protein